MTRYEIGDLITNLINGGTPVLALLITVISAYLVVAWSVGQKLTKSQVSFVNSVFLVFSPLLIFGWARRYQIALRLQEQLLSIDPGTIGGISQNLIAVVSVVFFILVLGSMKFMWDVRHPKKE